MNAWRDNPWAKHAPTNQELHKKLKDFKAVKRKERRARRVFRFLDMLPWILLIGGAVWLFTR